MIAIRKFGYSALVLAAFAGCSQEQPAPTTPPTPPAETKAEPTDAKPTPAPETTPAEKPAPSSEIPKVEAPSSSPAPKEEAKSEGNAASVTLDPEEIAEIKKLSAADAEAAMKQLVCPVGEGHLGAMGVPVKYTALGKTFFLCCKSCIPEVKNNPDAVVAKLKK
jgi:hypothetical protein